MAKLTVYNFDELTKEQQRRIMNDFSSKTGLNTDYLNVNFPREEVNAEVAVDEDGTIYDIRVFDPFHLVDNELYVYSDGWSDWLYEYRDPAGNDVDDILEVYDGVLQDD